jgi:UDP-glucose 4-epimerase
MSANVLVTGGGGFIGSHMVERLVERDDRVRVLDNFATGNRENLARVIDDIDLVEGDIQSYERVHNAVRGCELVFHLAALPSVPRSIQDPLTSNASNVIGTLNMLLAARDAGVRRVIYASSSSVYGANTHLPKREANLPLPMAPYAVSKLAGEGYCRSFTEVYGLETVALRYFNVYGPRQDPLSAYAAVIPRFIEAFLDGQRPVIYGDGAQSRDFTYVEDVVEANLRAAAAEGAAGDVFNVARGQRVSLGKMVEMLRELTGRDLEPIHGDPRAGDVRESEADTSRTKQILGYAPQTDLEEGLRLTIEDHERRREQRGDPVRAAGPR